MTSGEARGERYNTVINFPFFWFSEVIQLPCHIYAV
jgi:hypothetical protein